MTKKFWIRHFRRPRPLSNLEVFYFENRIDEIAAMEAPGEREAAELKWIILILEDSYNRVTFGPAYEGAAA